MTSVYIYIYMCNDDFAIVQFINQDKGVAIHGKSCQKGKIDVKSMGGL